MLEINTFTEQLNIIGITMSPIMDQLRDVHWWNEVHPDFIPLNKNLKEIMLNFKKDINKYIYNQQSLDDVIQTDEQSATK